MNQLKRSVDIWKNKLLDTTKNNQAINFISYKNSQIELIINNFDDFLVTIQKLNIEFAEIDEKMLSSANINIKDIYQKEELAPLIEQYLKKNKVTTKNDYVFSNLSNKRQRLALKTLISRAKMFHEENAINILYMAIGFINWKESKDSDLVLKSPLFLIPVEIIQDNFDGPYKLRVYDNDFICNEALLKSVNNNYKLDLSFEIDYDLDFNENYNDFKNYLSRNLNAKSIWIDDFVNIGLFQFSKINMLKDIEDNYDELIENKTIAKLAGVNLGFNENKDKKVKDNKQAFYQALDSDSSQQVAIDYAINGVDFVLEGPPGTGKSQTITNIITELIARGKKVLFIAEKKAALDVVYNNLKKIDLEDYSLNLHSNNLDKKNIIKELSLSLNERQDRKKVADEYLEDLMIKYKRSEKELNDFANALLEKKGKINLSVYEMIENYYKYQDSRDLRFYILNIRDIDKNTLDEIIDIIYEYEVTLKSFNNDISNSPFMGLNLNSVSQLEKERIENDLLEIINISQEIEDILSSDYYTYIDSNSFSLDKLKTVKTLFEIIKKINIYDRDILKLYKKSNIKSLSDDINYFNDLIDNNIVLESYHDVNLGLIEKDISDYLIILKNYDSKIKRIFSKKYKKTIKELNQQISKNKLSHNEIVEELNKAKKYYDKILEINLLKEKITLKKYQDLKSNELENIVSELENYYQLLYFLTKNKHFDYNISVFLESYFKNQKEITKEIKKYNKLVNNLDKYYQSLQKNFDLTILNLNKNDYLNNLVSVIKMNKEINNISEIIKYNNVIKRSKSLFLNEFFEAVSRENIDKDLTNIYLKRLYLLLVDNYLSEDKILNNFKREIYDKKREEFIKSDKGLIELAKHQISTNIEKNTPIVNGLESLNYEVKILLREVEKNRKLMPVRKLFENIPNLILNLKPCIMMSPLSVSTYLKNLDYKFDVVIFDEASQIQPESALGAIYRSKQTIIVGDSEQLPPTNFFQNIDKTENDENDVDSFESILNIAKASMDKVSLKWHYRSKFEELIYTSNSEIYKNLITFPEKNKPGKNEGLEFIYLDGIYENSENKIEALKVANLVKEHFYTYGFNRSIGIVTFNEQQQRLIEQEIDKMRRLNRSLDEYFSSNLKEPFFVKNIETVQGDERDTIIISIGYGPAPITKKISMNFGPLNKDGGYRRLNVAITRSKLNLKVVSSIRTSDIDLSKTDARGVKFLKEFLRISETRLINDLEKSVDDTKNFANDVSFELEKLGYEVDFNLGTSNYKIDLAVKNKNNKNEYILGIELDGSVYKIDDNARARERLKKEVLESRGWNIYRIWSVDWFRNKELELRRLVDQLENRFIHVDLNNTSEEVILEYVNEDTSLLDTFASYPNYDNLIKEVNTNNTLNDIRTIIKTLEPVHLDELKKIVPKYYDREVYSKYVDKKFIVDLDTLIYKEYLFNKDNDYIVSPNQSIYFRKTTINSTRRNFLNIHDLEIRDGIIAILKIVKIIEVEALTKKILEFSGYTNSSIEIRKKIDNILKTLVDEKIIIISKNLLNYINE